MGLVAGTEDGFLGWSLRRSCIYPKNATWRTFAGEFRGVPRCFSGKSCGSTLRFSNQETAENYR